MFRLHKIGFICILITWPLAVCAEITVEHTRVEQTSNSSLTKNFPYFKEIKQNNTFTEYVREHDVSQRWRSMETSVIKMLTAMYNETFPTMSELIRDLDISSKCKSDLMEMLTGIKEFKYWAVQMLDSFGKIPIGFERGTFNALGDFDQCLDVDVPGHFQGQYCNVDIILPLPKRQRFVKLHKELPELMNAIKPDGYFTFFGKFGRFFYFLNPRLSICVPSTCSKEELQKIANKAMQNMDLSFGIHIPNCEVLNKEIKFDNSEIAIMMILGILFLLVTVATVVDIYQKSTCDEIENADNCTSLPIKYLLCFSLYSNAKQIFKSQTDPIKIFHGMKALTALWIILVHSAAFLNINATGAFLASYWASKEISLHLVPSSTFSVETFFFISATLHAYKILKMKAEINVKKHIFRRIWRLAPSFMLVIACVILLPHVGSGPLWKETIDHNLADKCRVGWWTNLLFINNFIPLDDMCLAWFWYIPADFHLYILSLIALIPMKKNPSVGLLISFLIMVGFMIISAAVHVYYNLTPMVGLGFGDLEDVKYLVERGYIRSYLHCSSVCIGLAVGCFLVNRPAKIHISWKVSATLWLASFAGVLACSLGAYPWSQDIVPSIGIGALYEVGKKVVWSMVLAWITIACMTGNGGIVEKILSLPIFEPLERISYMVYLIHVVIHQMYIGSNRMSVRISLGTIVYICCGTVFLSYICAFILVLFFEAPFVALDKLIFAKKLKGNSEQLKIVEKKQLKCQ